MAEAWEAPSGSQTSLHEADDSASQLIDRRTVIFSSVSASAALLLFSDPTPVRAEGGSKSFAPGGTLVDYEVGVQVGNPLASSSRKGIAFSACFAMASVWSKYSW